MREKIQKAGKLFVFEGVDAAGKSTLAWEFAMSLKRNGERVRLVAFPGNRKSTLGELVYRLHHNSRQVGVTKITPSGVQALHIAAHLDAIETSIIPLLECGHCVILDRFWWSTWAYGRVTGVNARLLMALIDAERCAWGKWLPRSLFYITRRSPLRREPLKNWKALKLAYQGVAKSEAKRYPIHVIQNEISVSRSLEEIVSLAGVGRR